MRRAWIMGAGALLALGLCACQPAQPARTPEQLAATAAALTPADPKLADLYVHACKACHAVPGTGAPLAGDRAAWQPRAAKGMAGLMSSVLSGYKGMPAGGQCFACSANDYQTLIRFMADQPIS
jgi:cytochrome c5